MQEAEKRKGKGKGFERGEKTSETMDERDRRSIFIGGLSYVGDGDREGKERMKKTIQQDLEIASEMQVSEGHDFLRKEDVTGRVQWSRTSLTRGKG